MGMNENDMGSSCSVSFDSSLNMNPYIKYSQLLFSQSKKVWCKVMENVWKTISFEPVTYGLLLLPLQSTALPTELSKDVTIAVIVYIYPSRRKQN